MDRIYEKKQHLVQSFRSKNYCVYSRKENNGMEEQSDCIRRCSDLKRKEALREDECRFLFTSNCSDVDTGNSKISCRLNKSHTRLITNSSDKYYSV